MEADIPAAVQMIRDAYYPLAPIQLSLDSFKIFKNGRSQTLFVDVEGSGLAMDQSQWQPFTYTLTGRVLPDRRALHHGAR